jgi:hypothetical protein
MNTLNWNVAREPNWQYARAPGAGTPVPRCSDPRSVRKEARSAFRDLYFSDPPFSTVYDMVALASFSRVSISYAVSHRPRNQFAREAEKAK